jgi:hypothetical protein
MGPGDGWCLPTGMDSELPAEPEVAAPAGVFRGLIERQCQWPRGPGGLGRWLLASSLLPIIRWGTPPRRAGESPKSKTGAHAPLKVNVNGPHRGP